LFVPVNKFSSGWIEKRLQLGATPWQRQKKSAVDSRMMPRERKKRGFLAFGGSLLGLFGLFPSSRPALPV
jgi:hypothetical protein